MGYYDEDEDDYDSDFEGLEALFADEEDEEDTDDGADPGSRAVSFPAFPPNKRYGRKFADTWWGNAWIEAMQDTALDLDQLKSGRRYAFAGQVGPITVAPGRVSAPVHDGDHLHPHATEVRFAELSDAEWDRFLDKVAARAGHIAALLDREMPQDLVAAAADAGTRLLPGFGELDPECDCPGWDSPCKHAAALAYQVSWLLDRDPFVLLLLRGRSEAELTEELLRRNTGRGPAEADDAVVGVPAAQAWAAEVVAPPEPPAHVHRVLDLAPLLADTDLAEPPVDTAALAVLAADTAERAAALLAGTPVPTDDPWSDAIRLAARGDEDLRARAAAAGPRPADFTRGVLAWSHAGAEGLATLEDSWTPDRDAVARARADLAEAWSAAGLDGDPEVKVWRNRWTVEDRGWQLRLSTTGRWHPYTRDGSAWTPAGPPGATLTATLAELAPAE